MLTRVGKVGMSVLTKGLAMDWVREGKTGMAITSLWPAVVGFPRPTLMSSRFKLTSIGH